MLANQFGHFLADGRTFVITDPGTPMPWVNVVSNGRAGFVVSQSGGGFSWLDNSQLNVLTRWEMDLARDWWGKFLYLADRESGDVWSLAPTPCRAAYDEYRCEHTLGATTFTTRAHGIGATWTMGIAPADPVELWHIRLTNTTSRPRRLRIASYFEWCCGVAPDTKREFHRLFLTTAHDASRGAIIAAKNMWDVPPRDEKEHWNRPWPYVAAHAVGGIKFDAPLAIADKPTFLGRYGDPARPAAMLADAPTVGGFGRFGDAAAALGGDLTLAPGESVALHYTLAITDKPQQLTPLLDRYRETAAVEGAIAASLEGWKTRLSPTSVSTARAEFDVLNNHWLPYQAISGRLWARTGFYQQSGAFGYRDQLQDSQVWLPLDPARCRGQILHHAAHQFADGSVYHWWHPLTETGLRTKCSDDYLWLPFVIANYLKETGDLSILAAKAPFVDEKAPAPLLEHCRRAFARVATLMSPRGLPLIGSCDWNDGLSAVGVDGKGESVWLAMFLCAVYADWAVIFTKLGDDGGAADLLRRREGLIAAINAHAWDGEWFRCATLDSGPWIGASDNTEGRIYLNPQTWAVLADVATPERKRAAWRSAKAHLLKEMGPLLLAPAYTTPDPNIGYITRYAPGLRENGGVYMHAATWCLAAAAKLKDVDAVERTWRAIAPPVRAAASPGGAEAYRAEPYVMPGNVDGPDSATPGKAGWTWYTGSAAWLNRVCLEHILGIRPTWEGLAIDPCPFPSLGEVDVTRTWRGVRVRVRFDAAAYSPTLSPVVTVGGRPLKGNVIPAAAVEGVTSLDVQVHWAAVPPPHAAAPEPKPSSVPTTAAGAAGRTES